MKVKMFELHQSCKDKALKCKIMLTHAHIDGTGQVKWYRAVPFGQNPKDKDQLPGIGIFPDRIEGADKYMSVEIPVELLYTKATDRASGIKGTVTEFIVHPGGCLHVALTPDGRTETNGVPGAFEVDIRRLDSPLLTKLTAAELKKSEAKTPSPAKADGGVMRIQARATCAGFGFGG